MPAKKNEKPNKNEGKSRPKGSKGGQAKKVRKNAQQNPAQDDTLEYFEVDEFTLDES